MLRLFTRTQTKPEVEQPRATTLEEARAISDQRRAEAKREWNSPENRERREAHEKLCQERREDERKRSESPEFKKWKKEYEAAQKTKAEEPKKKGKKK